MEASYGSGFKASVLSKFPLNLSDHHVLSVAVDHGWSDAWMIKEKPRRGHKLREAAAAQLASGNVGAMLQQQQQPQPPQQPPQEAANTAPAHVPSAPLAAAVPLSAAPPPVAGVAAAPAEGPAEGPAELPAEAAQPERLEAPRTPEFVPRRAPATPAPPTPYAGAFSKAAPPVPPRERPNCRICFEPLTQEFGPVTALPCAHAFHSHCLSEWRDVQRITNMSRCPLNCHRSASTPGPGFIHPMFASAGRAVDVEGSDAGGGHGDAEAMSEEEYHMGNGAQNMDDEIGGDEASDDSEVIIH